MDDDCAHCGITRIVMVVMAAGKDGKRWRLCSKCWIDGLRPMSQVDDAPLSPTATVSPAAEPRVEPRDVRKRRRA